MRGLQAMLAAKERELVRSCLLLAFACVGFRNGQVLTCCLRLAVCRRQCEGRGCEAGRSREKSGTPSSSSSSSSFSSRQRQRGRRRGERAQSTLLPVLGVEGGGEEEDRLMSV